MNNSEKIKETSRIWVFTSGRKLSDQEADNVRLLARDFCLKWTAHKVALHAAASIIANTFLVISVDEEAHGASGCSIDAMHLFVRGIEKEFNTTFFDRLRVVFSLNESLENYSLKEFEELFSRGIVNQDTLVYNTLVSNGRELAENFLISVRDSWLAKRLK
jgi:hypothetical protein